MRAIVVSARGLRASALGCYGNGWVETPTLDGLAAEGVVFDRHLADAADADGAARSWRTGRYALPGGPDVPPTADLLAVLRDRGVYCALVTDAAEQEPLSHHAGWDHLVRTEGDERDEATALEAAVAAASKVLRRLAKRDEWLLWLDLDTVLPAWDVPPEFLEPYFRDEAGEGEDDEDDEDGGDGDVTEEDAEAEPLTPLTAPTPGRIDREDDTLYLRLLSSYAAAVSYLDAGLGELRDALTKLKLADSTAILVTSDAGQALGEHGVVGAVRPWLHEETVHVPLLVRLPDGAEAGRRVAPLTQAVDLGPTLAGLFGAELPGAHGHDLRPLLTGAAERVRPYACSGLAVGGGVEWALRSPEWALLLPVTPGPDDAARRPLLFVKPDDYWEVNDVRQHHLDLAEGLERALRAFVAATAAPGPFEAPALEATAPV
jgi:arylsulfatase A-like enzyme